MMMSLPLLVPPVQQRHSCVTAPQGGCVEVLLVLLVLEVGGAVRARLDTPAEVEIAQHLEGALGLEEGLRYRYDRAGGVDSDPWVVHELPDGGPLAGILWVWKIRNKTVSQSRLHRKASSHDQLVCPGQSINHPINQRTLVRAILMKETTSSDIQLGNVGQPRMISLMVSLLVSSSNGQRPSRSSKVRTPMAQTSTC